MSDHRWSFWKTVWAAGGLSVGGLLLLAWLTSALWSGSSPASPTGWLLWAATSLALGLLIVWSVLVAAGGLISLHRDSLEARGLPYHSRRPRERRAGAVLRTLRRIRRPFTAGISRRPGRLGLRPGELVEVQSLEEILATLDHRGTVDQLPFMPEMTASCGQQFRVLRRVEKVHDYVFMTGLRRMRDAVLLEGLRCSGYRRLLYRG